MSQQAQVGQPIATSNTLIFTYQAPVRAAFLGNIPRSYELALFLGTFFSPFAQVLRRFTGDY